MCARTCAVKDNPRGADVICFSNLPKFEHDCDHCIFLGHVCDHDLYYHAGTRTSKNTYPGETVIARWGNSGSEYSSGREFAKGIHAHLTIALQLARIGGHKT